MFVCTANVLSSSHKTLVPSMTFVNGEYAIVEQLKPHGHYLKCSKGIFGSSGKLFASEFLVVGQSTGK